MAFRRHYRSLLLPFPRLRSAHDAWVAFLIAAVADFEILDDPLIHYRLHEGNQFGLRLRGWADQYAQAKVQVDQGAFAYAEAFFEAAADRLRGPALEGFALREGVLDETLGKIEHTRKRDSMRGSLLARLPAVAMEALSGRYGRYSYGWKSVAQDLFLR